MSVYECQQCNLVPMLLHSRGVAPPARLAVSTTRAMKVGGVLSSGGKITRHRVSIDSLPMGHHTNMTENQQRTKQTIDLLPDRGN